MPVFPTCADCLRLVVVIEVVNNDRRDINLGIRARPAVIMTIHLDMAEKIVNTMAVVLHICNPVAQVLAARFATLIPARPSAHPVRNRRELATTSITAIVGDNIISGAVDFKHGQW